MPGSELCPLSEVTNAFLPGLPHSSINVCETSLWSDSCKIVNNI